MNLLKLLTSTVLGLCNLKSRNRLSQVVMLALLSGTYSVSSYAQQKGDFIPLPKFTTLDALGVNVSGNTVAPTVNTVAIGGEMGLSHNITLQGNTFSVAYSRHGYRDAFAGGIRYSYLGKKQLSVNAYPSNDLWVLNASAMGDSAQFVELCNGKFTGDLPANSCAPIYYEAVKDKRHTLSIIDGNVVWTKPDGTKVYFDSVGLSSSTNGNFTKIIYPNGFTINVAYFTVTTNTGYELKYDYVPDSRGVDASKANIPYYGSYTADPDWWRDNPKAILAINNAYEYCANQDAPCTNLTKSWPTVTFDWPGGMPKTFFMGKSVFRVINSKTNATAEFTYDAYDVNLIEYGQILPTFTKVAPRLTSIKPFGAVKPTVSYTYKNPYRVVSAVNCIACLANYYTDPEDPGILTTATGIVGTSSYSISDLGSGSIKYGKTYSGYRLSLDMDETYPSRLLKINAEGGERTILFDQFNLADQVQTDKSSSWSKAYTYTNNNVDTLTDQATGTTQAGGYEPSCINPTPDRNRKTCNKPAWVKVNGIETDYTYHQLSGEIETVTLPANKNGKRAQTRYEYTPLQATYLSASGTTLGSPIYLKTAEKYCINGNFIGSGNGNSVFTGACELGAADEVVTRYEYDPAKNLHLKGKTVTAVNTAGVPTVKRTCYQYDIYNNLIGETQPNANPASCN